MTRILVEADAAIDLELEERYRRAYQMWKEACGRSSFHPSNAERLRLAELTTAPFEELKAAIDASHRRQEWKHSIIAMVQSSISHEMIAEAKAQQ